MKFAHLPVLLVLAALLASGSTLPPGVVSVSSNVYTGSVPGSIIPNVVATENLLNNNVLLFNEKQDYVIGDGLTGSAKSKRAHIDFDGTVQTIQNGNSTYLTGAAAYLSDGTVVDSFYFHFDKKGTTSGSITPNNSTSTSLPGTTHVPPTTGGWVQVTFKYKILGFEVRAQAPDLPPTSPVNYNPTGASLYEQNANANDRQFQRAGVAYDDLGTAGSPTNCCSNGVEFTGANSDVINVLDAHTIQFQLHVSGNNVDDFRVFTAVPEPMTFGMIGGGLVLLGLLRRRCPRG